MSDDYSAAQKSCTANAKVAFSTALDNVCLGKGTVTGNVEITASGVIIEGTVGGSISFDNYGQCKDSKEAKRDAEIASCEAIEENANQWCPAQ